jgi:hypothetical protein
MNELAELRARLAAAQEAKADAEEAAKPTDEEALLAAVVKAELEATNAKARADAIKAHGPLGVKIQDVPVLVDGRMVIVKRPHPAALTKFLELANMTSEEQNMLVSPCVVYPSKSAFQSLIEELPGVLGSCTVAVCKLGGVQRTELAGK